MNYASAAFWVLCEEGMDYSTHEVVQGNRSTVLFCLSSANLYIATIQVRLDGLCVPV